MVLAEQMAGAATMAAWVALEELWAALAGGAGLAARQEVEEESQAGMAEQVVRVRMEVAAHTVGHGAVVQAVAAAH